MPAYHSPVYWFPVKVPCTVLTGLVANRVYPDPYSGMNNMLIPDASDSFNIQYDLGKYSHIPNVSNPWKNPYWYRTTFQVPAADKGRRFQLIFKAINYRAAVWVNGHPVADSAKMAGMFAEYFLDITDLVKAGELNALAVKIYPLDYPGLPAREQLKALDDFYENGGSDRGYRQKRYYVVFGGMGLASSCQGPQYGHLATGIPENNRGSNHQPAPCDHRIARSSRHEPGQALSELYPE